MRHSRKSMYRKIANFPAFRAEAKKQLTLRNWTYSDLSDYVGYSSNYLYCIMSGQGGSKRAAVKIARVLNISTDLALHKILCKSKSDLANLDHIHKLTDSIKNIDKIIMLENGGYSEAGEWSARGMYGNESSYANRGEHYVRGHYSRDAHDNDMYSGRRDNRGRYSRDDGRSGMLEHMRNMMDNAETEKDREIIRRCVKQLEEG